MLIHYYNNLEDAQNHKETVEAVRWVDGFATGEKTEIVFKRANSGEEVSIPFTNFISAVQANTIGFRNDDHAEQWAEAVEQAGALRDDDTVKADFAASLYIITGIPGLYGRVKQHIHRDWIDFEPMLEMGLSSGERLLVALAGNLYNGGFFRPHTPLDIIESCDAGMVELAVTALYIRRQTVNINTVFDTA